MKYYNSIVSNNLWVIAQMTHSGNEELELELVGVYLAFPRDNKQNGIEVIIDSQEQL